MASHQEAKSMGLETMQEFTCIQGFASALNKTMNLIFVSLFFRDLMKRLTDNSLCFQQIPVLAV